jgi:hypothetical protein
VPESEARAQANHEFFEHDPEKWVPVSGANSAKVGTGFVPEFAPRSSKNAFSSREPASTSLENAFYKIMLPQKEGAL